MRVESVRSWVGEIIRCLLIEEKGQKFCFKRDRGLGGRQKFWERNLKWAAALVVGDGGAE